MMIFLLILKIIGIILCVILGIVAVILFAPVFYEADANIDEMDLKSLEQLKQEYEKTTVLLEQEKRKMEQANVRELLQGQIYFSFYSFFLCTAIL